MPDPWTTSSLMWTAVFSVILVTSIIGNCGVLWIILGIIIHYWLEYPRLDFIRLFQPTVQCGQWQTISSLPSLSQTSSSPPSIAYPPSSSWETGSGSTGVFIARSTTSCPTWLFPPACLPCWPSAMTGTQWARWQLFVNVCNKINLFVIDWPMTNPCHPAHWLCQEEGEMLKVQSHNFNTVKVYM